MTTHYQTMTGFTTPYPTVKKSDVLKKRIRNIAKEPILLVDIGGVTVGTTQLGFDMLVERDLSDL